MLRYKALTTTYQDKEARLRQNGCMDLKKYSKAFFDTIKTAIVFIL